MRRRLAKLRVPILIGLLACSLASSEFSELLQLRDDVSNDFCLQVFSGPQLLRASLARFHPVVLSIKAHENAVYDEVALSALFPVTTPRPTRDLLHLLSVQRI
jgi:hypothetical protein